jgi:ligand-binding sensor domain-containing protein
MTVFIHIRKALVIGIISFILCDMHGQEPVFVQYTTQQGLASNTVYCGALDQQGNLCFGTDKGLSIFNGLRFENLDMQSGLPDPEVLSLLSAKNGDLWISCFTNKLCIRRNGKILNSNNDTLLSKISLDFNGGLFFEDNDGSIWIYGGDNFIKRVSKGIITSFKVRYAIVGFCLIDSTSYYFDAFNFYKNDKKNNSFTPLAVSDLPNLEKSNWNNLTAYDDYILVMRKYAHLYKKEGNEFKVIDTNPLLSGIVSCDSKGRFWIASTSDGVYCFPKGATNLDTFDHYLQDKSITSVTEDGHGGYWLGTVGEGVYRFTPGKTYSYLNNDKEQRSGITAIGQASNKDLIVGDNRGQIHIVRKGKVKSYQNGENKYNKTRNIVQTNNGGWVISDSDLFFFDNNYQFKKK